MQDNDHNTTSNYLATDPVATVDAVARAAHLWIRSLCLHDAQSEEERHAMASGLVAGLCERLALTPRIRPLVAYVYTLLDNEGSQALAASRLMLEQPVTRAAGDAYVRGKSEATGITEMVRYHDLHKLDAGQEQTR